MAKSASTVSVLMSTYGREKADYLAESLESVYSQTRVPDEVVLVVDGSVDDDQQRVINRYMTDSRITRTRVVHTGRQSGLAAALNAGLAACTGELVMRMDSDDVSHPDRLRIQVNYMETHPEIDLVGTWGQEFETLSAPLSIKAAPAEHANIVKALRWRNVLVHPSILVRRVSLAAVGDYRVTVGKLEDYDLFVRLALNGSRFHIIDKPLLFIRVNMAQRSRRGGIRHLVHDIQFRADIRRSGFLSWKDFMLSVGAYSAFRLVPTLVRNRLYSLVRSKPAAAVGRIGSATPGRSAVAIN